MPMWVALEHVDVRGHIRQRGGILVDEVTPLQLNGAAQNQHTPRGAGGFLARGPPATAAPSPW